VPIIQNGKRSADHVPRTPNGLPISGRERATTSLQKPNDLAREAVGCMGGLLE
jgi:hypothetical protein